MGICVPRPAMRRREERNIHKTLAHHQMLTNLLLEYGMCRSAASGIALVLIKTAKQRKQIWRTR